MITLRESEIRSEALSLAIDAYQMVSLLPTTTGPVTRSQFIDDSFRISSCIAEAFKAITNEQSADAIANSLERLQALQKLYVQLFIKPGISALPDSFHTQLEALHYELTELLAALNLLNQEAYPSKLELACI